MNANNQLNMDNLQWRSPAHCFAVVDLTLICIKIFLIIFAVVYVANASSGQQQTMGYSDNNREESASSFPVWAIVLIVVIVAIIIGIQLSAASKLLQSTQTGKEPSEALRNTKIWITVTTVFLVFSVIGYIKNLQFVPLIITSIYAASGLYIVSNFKQELESVIASLSAATPASDQTTTPNNHSV